MDDSGGFSRIRKQDGPAKWCAVDGEDEFAFRAGEEDGLVEDQQAAAALTHGKALAVNKQIDLHVGGIAHCV